MMFGFSLCGTSAPLERGSSGAPEWGGNTFRPRVAYSSGSESVRQGGKGLEG